MIVNVVCDRCGETVEGISDENYTGGFYNATDSYWSKYCNPGEKVVCDRCMWNDPRYQKDYGSSLAKTPGKGIHADTSARGTEV